MAEIRAILLPTPEPLRLRHGPGLFAGAALRPLARGLVFLAALSLPVLGCTLADRSHGSVPRPEQVAAAPLSPPQSRAAAKIPQTGASRAPAHQALLTPAKFSQSLSLQ